MKKLIFTLMLVASVKHQFTMQRMISENQMVDMEGVIYTKLSSTQIEASNGITYQTDQSGWHGSDGSNCKGQGRTFSCL